MFIAFPGHGMLSNINNNDHIYIRTVRGKSRLLHKPVLYLNQSHNDAKNGKRRKYVVMKSEIHEEICAVWRNLIKTLNDVEIRVETTQF